MEELKSCPWCGGKAIVWRDKEPGNNRFAAGCEDWESCDVSPCVRLSTKEQVIKAWNTRMEKE